MDVRTVGGASKMWEKTAIARLQSDVFPKRDATIKIAYFRYFTFKIILKWTQQIPKKWYISKHFSLFKVLHSSSPPIVVLASETAKSKEDKYFTEIGLVMLHIR